MPPEQFVSYLWVAVALIIFLQLLILLRVTSASGAGVAERLAPSFDSLKSDVTQRSAELRESVERLGMQLRHENSSLTHALTHQLDRNRDSLDATLNRVQERVDTKLSDIQTSNDVKLEQMRATVDEKLHATLEKRLGESFRQVSSQLESVQRGLGEMQNLAADVGNLNRVLTNVKARGILGETQLLAILEQILTPEQYVIGYQPGEGREVVEFAVKLPGPSRSDLPVYLPIDAKFPKEDYERLVDASEQGDRAATESARRDLLVRLERSARDICEKYIQPPTTTPFGIMFLPTEGLFAEALREPGFHDRIRQQYHVVITGPTTISALLSSLRLGFQTLAIEQRSAQVWEILGSVRTEFTKFGNVLERVKRQLGTASRSLDKAAVRTRAMERTLRSVDTLADVSPGASIPMAEGEARGGSFSPPTS